MIKKFVDTEEKNMDKDSSDALDVPDRLTGSVEAPEDWAVQHDHYLYGTPKSLAATNLKAELQR